MEEVSVRSVSSKEYSKRAKKKAGWVRKKIIIGKLKINIFHVLISALFFLIIALACTAMMNVKSLWYDTLIKPPFVPRTRFFIICNMAMFAILGYIFYRALTSGSTAHIVGMAINGIFYVMVAYTFYILKSPLGSFIVISVLIAQTVTVAMETWKAKKVRALFLVLVILWQCYILLVDYFILMLN